MSAKAVYTAKDIPGLELVKLIRQHEPDVVILHYPEWLQLEQVLQASGIRVPEDLSVAVITVPDDDDHAGGVVEKSHYMGTLAVDSLIHQITNGRHNTDQNPPHRLVIDGMFTEGQTICAPRQS